MRRSRRDSFPSRVDSRPRVAASKSLRKVASCATPSCTLVRNSRSFQSCWIASVLNEAVGGGSSRLGGGMTSAKLIELGCGRLQPHPASLTYASSCVVPVEWFELPLLTQREHNHDTTVYGFGLPQREQRLSLPACACLLVRAPGRGRDGRDAVRAYFFFFAFGLPPGLSPGA